MTDYRFILYDVDQGIARVTLNRPRYRNVQSTELLHEMDAAIMKAADDPAVRVIVLLGTGDHFSAGHDMGTPEEKTWRDAHPIEPGIRGFYGRTWDLYVELHLRWRNVAKPVLSAVQGYCIWGGWMVAASADVLFAAEDALFLGTLFQYFTVPWDIAPRRAKEILFQARFVGAAEAKELGLVNRVVPRERLEEEVMAYARDVAANDPFEMRMTKLAVNQVLDIQGFTASVRGNHAHYMLHRFAEQDPGYAVAVPEDGRKRPMVRVALERYRADQARKKGEPG